MTKAKEAGEDTDAFGVWRQLYDENERAWSAALEQAMGSSEFGESSGRLLETMLAAQKSVRGNMRVYLETMNVPTREDIARLGELVVGLEEKVDQIADRLDTIDGTLRGRSADTAKLADRLDGIDGTLRSRSADTGKIDRIAKRLDTIDRATRGRPADTAKINRIAKRLDTIDSALRRRSAQDAKPAMRATSAVAANPAGPATRTRKPTTKTTKTATRTVTKPAAKQGRPATTAKPATAASTPATAAASAAK
jgi:polyhydroxyalkanoic acid synthase PhaR subunit